MSRGVRLRWFVVAIFCIIIFRLFYIQVIDQSYKERAANNALRYEVQYPPRGEVYDRNGEFLVQSKEAYDLVVVPRNIKAFDTLMMCSVVGMSIEDLRKELAKATAFSHRRPSVIVKQMTMSVKLRLDELNFPGFYTIYRTVRMYPRKIAGNLLGYVGEVNDRIIERDPYYRSGDFIGLSGIEGAYESVLRGRKGVKISMVDVHGIYKGSYGDGIYDTLAAPGSAITSTIDARLQELAEQLLVGKVGSVVAIEPSTGEILVMASSPSYDPDQLVGRERGNNYMKMLENKRQPLFNRAVMSNYPPGSVFKLVNGLIGLQQGEIVPTTSYPCYGGYTVGRGVKCHSHSSPVNLIDAVKVSCNAYFCFVLRDVMDNRKTGGIREQFDLWRDYVLDFGFGRKLNSDFTGELTGNVPTSQFYDKRYNKKWNSLSIISLAIGQGEMLSTPLQMANFAATIANRGHYYIPHVVKRIHDRDSIDRRFYERHTTKVASKHFDPIVEGMWRAVHRPEGTAQVAFVEGLEICGKTGTAQNPHGADHSTFLCFAPRNNPKISVSVYIENGRFGATVAAPIASLITEQYLTDTIHRAYLVDYVKNMQIAYPYYDRR